MELFLTQETNVLLQTPNTASVSGENGKSVALDGNIYKVLSLHRILAMGVNFLKARLLLGCWVVFLYKKEKPRKLT